MALESPYWNPWLETLDREKLRSLQLTKFKRILSWAYEHSPFHRKLYQDAGLEPGDIRTFSDIGRVPKMEKGLLKEAQAEADLTCAPGLQPVLENFRVGRQE